MSNTHPNLLDFFGCYAATQLALQARSSTVGMVTGGVQ